jgi:hypothetical protein
MGAFGFDEGIMEGGGEYYTNQAIQIYQSFRDDGSRPIDRQRLRARCNGAAAESESRCINIRTIYRELVVEKTLKSKWSPSAWMGCAWAADRSEHVPTES